MGDCIDRQAVLDGIEELKKSPWATDKRGNGFEYLIKEALEVVADLCVKQLPSVTPNKSFDGMTNGEVIKALFPYIEAETYEYTTSVKWLDCDKDASDPYSYFWSEWWNAPYTAESEAKNDT